MGVSPQERGQGNWFLSWAPLNVRLLDSVSGMKLGLRFRLWPLEPPHLHQNEGVLSPGTLEDLKEA